MKQKKPNKATLKISQIITNAGLSSHRKAKELILSGQVTLNGKIITDPSTTAEFGIDHIKVSGKLITKKEPLIYYAFHKPSLCVSTLYDTQKRHAIKDFLKRIKFQVLPAGNLPYHSSGILILTNDGQLINTLNNTQIPVPALYRFKVSGTPSQVCLLKLKNKFQNLDKSKLPIQLRIWKKTEKNAWLELKTYTLNHKQIFLYLKNHAHPIQKFTRIKHANISIKGLLPGSYRILNQKEIIALKKLKDNASK